MTRALRPQTGTHSPHAGTASPIDQGKPGRRRRLIAPFGQELEHSPQRTQRFSRKPSSGLGEMHSGLAHQRQASGQPFRKTVVRIPGPSWTE